MNSCLRSSVMCPVAVSDVDQLAPLGLGQPDLGRERMEVRHEGPHQLPQPGLAASVEARDRGGRDLLRRGPFVTLIEALIIAK